MGEAATFITAPIRSFAPPHAPDIVLALHACDTATGESWAWVCVCMLMCVYISNNAAGNL
jgi:hypothetical protein